MARWASKARRLESENEKQLRSPGDDYFSELDAEEAADRRGVAIFGPDGPDRGEINFETRIHDERRVGSLHESGLFESRRMTWPRWIARGEAIDVDVLSTGPLLACVFLKLVSCRDGL